MAGKRPNAGKGSPGHRARSLSRRLALQALYQIQMNPRSWQDTQQEFAADPEADRVDLDYFRSLIAAIAPNREALDSRLARAYAPAGATDRMYSRTCQRIAIARGGRGFNSSPAATQQPRSNSAADFFSDD